MQSFRIIVVSISKTLLTVFKMLGTLPSVINMEDRLGFGEKNLVLSCDKSTGHIVCQHLTGYCLDG